MNIMDKKIRDLENEINNIKSSQRKIEFEKILDDILTEDFGKMIEDRIFEEEYGCWVSEDGDKIYKHVDEKISNDNNIVYKIFGKQVENIPKAEEVVFMHRFPHQICECQINNKRYRYMFSKRVLKKYNHQYQKIQSEYPTDDIKIYKILYCLHKQLKK